MARATVQLEQTPQVVGGSDQFPTLQLLLELKTIEKRKRKKEKAGEVKRKKLKKDTFETRQKQGRNNTIDENIHYGR
jgi:hypothetical protein